MKVIYFYWFLFFVTFASYAQKVKPGIDAQSNGTINKRISFIAGVGASYITQSLYADPVVNQTNNFVEIENAKKIKTNLTLGIAYTPKTINITSPPSISKNAVGDEISTQETSQEQKGFTVALFVNPILFSKITESQSFFNSTDFGVGFGHRFPGGLLVLGTAEFFSVKQPRNWFIEQFKGNSSQYILNNAAQKSIDINDNSIFTFKPVITFGFKICYSFDIIKSFTTTTTTTTNKATVTKEVKRVD